MEHEELDLESADISGTIQAADLRISYANLPGTDDYRIIATNTFHNVTSVKDVRGEALVAAIILLMSVESKRLRLDEEVLYKLAEHSQVEGGVRWIP